MVPSSLIDYNWFQTKATEIAPLFHDPSPCLSPQNKCFETLSHWVFLVFFFMPDLHVFLSGKLLQVLFLLLGSQSHITGPLAFLLWTALTHDFLLFSLLPRYFSLILLCKKGCGGGGHCPHHHSGPQLLLSTSSGIPRVPLESSTFGWQIRGKKGPENWTTLKYTLFLPTSYWPEVSQMTHLTKR